MGFQQAQRKSNLEEEEFTRFHSSLKRGDIVGIVGFPGKRKRGELITFRKTFVVLSHCLHMMPRQKIGPGADNGKVTMIIVGPGADNGKETRYRERCLDLLLNSEVREIFRIRSKVISHIRRFLDERDFWRLKVLETPMMNMIAGDVAARPFVTYHNDMNMRLYMWSAPELYINELVAGLELH